MQEIFALAHRSKAVLVALLSVPTALSFWQHLGWQSLPLTPGEPESLSRHLKWRGSGDPLALAKELEALSDEHSHRLTLMVQFMVAV